ncbi:MAG: guanylate kinase [Anaerolineae bacterium]
MSNSLGHNPYHIESNPLLVVISGPSGAGKDATVKRMEELGYPFHFVVTATTRPRRPNEVDGVDYHFVSKQEFAEMLEKGELLEHAIVYGQHKGIPRKQVREALESGEDVIMRIDVQGAATIRHLVPEAIFVFLTASSEEELIRRLKKRKTETPEGLKKRIATAREEMERLDEFDYVVVNRDDHLDETVETIAAIITAERCKVKQRKIELRGGIR